MLYYIREAMLIPHWPEEAMVMSKVLGQVEKGVTLQLGKELGKEVGEGDCTRGVAV